ncbi:MAG: hypothetical protein GY856_31030, partial [bacterium]|nr:hypothetical protein [bacterium]
MNRIIRTMSILVVLVALLMPGILLAQGEPQRTPDVAAKVYRHTDLDIQTQYNEIGQLPPQAAAQAQQRLARLGVAAPSARVDRRSGRFATLLPATPLIPGKGVGNDLRWGNLKVRGDQAAYQAFRGYLDVYQADLGIDLGELSPSHRVTSHGAVYQIYLPRTIDGLPVRGSYVSAVINHGNLVLMGAHKWGDRGANSNRPELSREDAQAAADAYIAPLPGSWSKGEQLYVPMARGQAPSEVGQGYRYQRVWAFQTQLPGDAGNWEALVNVHTGEVLAFEDLNQYAEIKGGVLPVTNDGIDPDGVEQAGWPMPYQVTTLGTTDTGGNVAGSGSITATFYGPYVDINDNCGTDSLTQNDNIDWGTSGGTDCTTPGFGGAGNTHASRTGFYEPNKIIEMARGQLPSNSWLQSRLTSNMNINSTCNA